MKEKVGKFEKSLKKKIPPLGEIFLYSLTLLSALATAAPANALT